MIDIINKKGVRDSTYEWEITPSDPVAHSFSFLLSHFFFFGKKAFLTYLYVHSTGSNNSNHVRREV